MTDLAATQDVIRRLYVRRVALGLSQRALAGRMGTAQSHISGLENGRIRPGFDLLNRWAEALDLKLRISLDDTWEAQ